MVDSQNPQSTFVEEDFKDSLYCYLAFNGFNTNNTNKADWMPCCGIDTNHWNHQNRSDNISFVDAINNKQLVEIRKKLNQNIWPDPCSHCKNAEEQGFQSMRQGWNFHYNNIRREYNGDIPPHLNVGEEYIRPEHVGHMEVAFDNVCNSKCMTCGSGASSLWRDEEIAIWDKPESPSVKVNLNDITIDEIINQCVNLSYINIYGGEPTVSDQHYKFISKLVESGRAPDITIQMVTNLSNITNEYIDLWQHFKHISLTVSIDGLQSVNEYIRYPFKWTKTTRNLKRIKDLTTNYPDRYSFGCSTTISLFNAHDVIDLIKFWDKYCDSDLHLNRVTMPEYTAIEMLTDDYKQNCIERIDNGIPELIRENSILRANQVKQWLLEKHNKPEPRHVKKLIQLVEGSDNFRNRSIKDFIPHLHDQILKIKEQNIIA